jgi:hypothetical protein
MKRISPEQLLRIISRRKESITANSNPPENKKVEEKTEIENENENEMIFKPFKNSRKRKEIDKWERITGQDTIFISFISDPPESDFYSTRAKDLIRSLENLGYDYSVVYYESDRNYYQNCCFKPTFIQNKLSEFNKNIVWIDADTFLRSSMDAFIKTDEEFDIGLVTYNGNMTGFVASPLFFRNTPTSISLIKRWSDHCVEKMEEGYCELDHDAIKHEILPEFKRSIKIKLNWDLNNSMHNGDILINVNSDVPYKRRILAEMRTINAGRPCNYTNNDYNII